MEPSVLLLRHGQASFGAADYDVLSGTGLRQAARLGEELRARVPGISAVVSGTMRRQRETADACLHAMGLGPDVPRVFDPAWNEFDHVEVLRVYEPRWADQAAFDASVDVGTSVEAFDRLFLAAVARWTSGENDGEYLEPWPAFLGRVDAGLKRISPGASGPVLVFTSGGPIAAACRKPLGAKQPSEVLSHAFRVANASITAFENGEGGFALASFNDHAHLSGALLTFR